MERDDIDVRIGKRGQVVIPAIVRRRLRLRSGDLLNLIVDEDWPRLVLAPVPAHRLERFREAAAKFYEGIDVDDAINQLRDEWEQ